jgi:hypothetical protein
MSPTGPYRSMSSEVVPKKSSSTVELDAIQEQMLMARDSALAERTAPLVHTQVEGFPARISLIMVVKSFILIGLVT